MKIDVVNGYRHGFKDGVYISRGGKGSASSPLANPFKLKENNRTICLKQYKNWLTRQYLNHSSKAYKELIRIKKLSLSQNINLICFCKPKACHGDIIKEFVENIDLKEEV